VGRTWWRQKPGLKTGDRAPDFDRPDEDGRRHNLGQYLGRWLVVFFYPKDNTPVCVKEACAFNDQWQEFRDLNADILGCSGQDAESHQRMRAACRLRYRLLCDGDRSMREAWKVPHQMRVNEGRTTYLVDPQGVIRFIFSDPVRGEDHAVLTLEFLRQAAGQPV
jgi:peroxiredoxin Q/BCP